jgi:hypothetical protein
MHTNISKLHIKLGEKDYIFLCDIDSPLDAVKEALFQFQKYIGQFEDSIKTKLKEQQEKEQSKVEPMAEVANV